MADDAPPQAEAAADAPGRAPATARRPRRPPGALAGIASAMLLIAFVGGAIGRGHTFAFDRAILRAMRDGTGPIGPAWIEHAMIGITALGGVTVLTIVAVPAIALLARRRLWRTAWLVAGAAVSGRIAVDLAKRIVARPRPDVIDHLVQVSSPSFPSGHSANGAIVYLTLAIVLARLAKGRARRGAIVIAAVLLVIAIGCSRVYLGVHWPSDVLAGWGFGALWALGWVAPGAGISARRAGAAPP